jgi:hypothetical protein
VALEWQEDCALVVEEGDRSVAVDLHLCVMAALWEQLPRRGARGSLRESWSLLTAASRRHSREGRRHRLSDGDRRCSIIGIVLVRDYPITIGTDSCADGFTLGIVFQKFQIYF